jgi:hydrogenase expression/formation protein HypE
MTREFSMNPDTFSCPLPRRDDDFISLAHGGGGKLSQQLIEEAFLPEFSNRYLQDMHDGATLNINNAKIAFTTDSHVITPIFFPGGDIGSLSVCGTVNDLAMCGAKPLFISAGFIIEEGFGKPELIKIVQSMQMAAKRADVHIVTGDTKVVDRGKADKLYINTSGIGIVENHIHISPKRAKPGDSVILSGTIADHGIAVLSNREGLTFDTRLHSDVAPLSELVQLILNQAGDKIHVLRDPTRGGVASALNEIAQQAKVGVAIHENEIRVKDEVRGACELLGFDPLYVANEGKFLCIAAQEKAKDIVETMRAHPLGKQATVIGTVTEGHPGRVLLKTGIGGTRIVEMISGEQLPRIC